jgi:adenine-specific DNA-methyltransferase
LPETFNYLVGLHVESRRVYDNKGERYLVYRGRVEARETAVIWRTTRGWTQKEFEATAILWRSRNSPKRPKTSL